jgi:hypothetical protein
MKPTTSTGWLHRETDEDRRARWVREVDRAVEGYRKPARPPLPYEDLLRVLQETKRADQGKQAA